METFINKTSRPIWGLLQLCSGIKLQTLFIVIFLLFGSIMIVIVPPGWDTDEVNHVYRIYQLSTGDILSQKVTDPQSGLKAYGGLEPKNLTRLFYETRASVPGTLGNPQYKIPTNLYKTAPYITKLKYSNQQQPVNFSGAALYSPVAYLIYIPVFLLGKLLSLSFFWIIILSRVFGLIVTALTFFFAIKYMPIGKWIMFTVGLVPTVVAQATTVGADAPQIVASVIFITYFVKKLFSDKKLKLLDYGIFTGLGIVLILIKFVYVPLLLLLLAFPLIKKEYRQSKHILLILCAIIISIIPGLIWIHLISYIDINSNPQANFAAQKLFIIGQPYTYIKVIYNTFFTNTQTALNNLFGSFIWDSTSLPAIYSYIASVAITLSLFVRSRLEISKNVLSEYGFRIWRLLLAITSLVTFLLITSALYIYSTTLHQSSIVGIQSRYFMPLLPIILLIFYGNTAKNQRTVKLAIMVFSCIALVGAVLTISFRLYHVLPLIYS